ncbi:MAG: MATE family efflux transporter [Candidatus Micrarchaeia archaeon]
MSHDLTEGKITLPLLKMAAPLVLAASLSVIYVATDAFWLGQLGPAALAAMTLGAPVLLLVANALLGIASAGSTLASHFKGAHNERGVNKAAKQTLLAAAALSLVLGVLGFFISPSIISLFGAPAAVSADASAYLTICFAGLFFGTLFSVAQFILNGLGDTRTPTLVLLGSVLLNFILDPLFINGFGPIPALGVAGAAWATLCTQVLTGAIGVWLLVSGTRGVRVKLLPLDFDFSFFKRLARLGVPASLEFSVYQLWRLVEVYVVSWFGIAALAAYGVSERVLSLLFLPATGLSIATGVAVGQNLGAGKRERAIRVAERGSLLAFMFLLAMTVCVVLFGTALAGFFVPGETAVIASAFLFMFLHALSLPFNGVRMTLTNVARVSGNAVSALYLSTATIALRILVVLLFAYYLGFYGVALTMPVVSLVALVILYYWFRKSGWWKTRVVEEGEFAAAD